jgi:hypothetical protein
MGYYLPTRSYMKPKLKNSMRNRVFIFTSAVSIFAIVTIITTIQLLDNYSATANNVKKGEGDIALMGTEKYIPVITNTGNIDFPAQIAFFIVEAGQYTVDIKWATVSEYKNAYFVLERSYNNSDFKAIAQFDAHGTTKQSNDYSYTDDSLMTNVAFYRLKQISESGESTFVGIEKAVKPQMKRDEELYIENIDQQPTDKGFNINYYSEIDGGIKVELIDMSGEPVFKSYTKAEKGYNTCRFENSEMLKENQYTLRISNSTAVYTMKVRNKLNS